MPAPLFTHIYMVIDHFILLLLNTSDLWWLVGMMVWTLIFIVDGFFSMEGMLKIFSGHLSSNGAIVWLGRFLVKLHIFTYLLTPRFNVHCSLCARIAPLNFQIHINFWCCHAHIDSCPILVCVNNSTKPFESFFTHSNHVFLEHPLVYYQLQLFCLPLLAMYLDPYVEDNHTNLKVTPQYIFYTTQAQSSS